MTVEPQPAGPTFARSARVNDVRTYIYIYIYKKHIYIYDEDFSPLYDKCGARSARRLNYSRHGGGGVSVALVKPAFKKRYVDAASL